MKNKQITWRTTSKETALFCKKTGYDPAVHFVETVVIDGIVFVSGTAGHPDEYKGLEQNCRKLAYEGYAYFGGPRCNLATAFYKYRILLFSLEQERRAEEFYNVSTVEELEENAKRLRADIEVLVSNIKTKRLGK
jgi:hypothetical protein